MLEPNLLHSRAKWAFRKCDIFVDHHRKESDTAAKYKIKIADSKLKRDYGARQGSN